MRTLDRVLPDVIVDEDVAMLADWPVRPVIALDSGTTLTRWDGTEARWDDTDAEWDSGWADATCAFTGMEIDSGVSDEAGLFPAARCVVQLDNRDGAWSILNADGSPARYGPGTAIIVYAHNADGDWWLFSGTIARYDQRSDDTIEIEAFDKFSDLAQPIGTYTPGTNGEHPGVRLSAILGAAGESATPHSFATGTVALTAQETDKAPLEEMQVVAQSDGGLLYVDADGTVVSTDRLWRTGRDDQVAIPTASDNVCTAEFMVWDAVLSSNDDSLADKVVLENVAGLQAVSGSTPGFVISLTEQQWTTQTEGDILAALALSQQEDRQVAISEFTLYLLDPLQPDLWRAVDWRRLDQLRFVHDQSAVGGAVRVDVTTLIDSLLHEITPEGWVMTVGTSKVMASTAPSLYDSGVLYDTGEEYGY